MGIAPSTAAPATVTRETPMPLAILAGKAAGHMRQRMLCKPGDLPTSELTGGRGVSQRV